MIRLSTINGYQLKVFAVQLLKVSSVLLILLFISSAFDITQKYKSIYISPTDLWLLIIYKIPYLFCELASASCFLSTILFFQTFRKSRELIIMLSSGIPLWNIVMIPAVTSLAYGFIILFIIGPIGTVGLNKYQRLEATISDTPSTNFAIFKTGIYFHERFSNTNRVIYAKSIDEETNTIRNLSIMITDKHNNLIEHIESPEATLENYTFNIFNATIVKTGIIQKIDQINIPTSISIKNMMMQFNRPETVQFWNLGSMVNKFIESGFSVTKYQLYYYKLIFRPLSMLALAMVACCFICINPRDKKNRTNLILAVSSGIFSYFILELSYRVLAYSNILPLLSVLLPILVIIMISNFVILHFHEA